MSNIVLFNSIEEKIISILYGVETRKITQAIKNNPDKFPEGYIFELSKMEKREVIKNFDNPKIKFSPALPKAFTKKGCYMLATILKSQRDEGNETVTNCHTLKMKAADGKMRLTDVAVVKHKKSLDKKVVF
jgi:hypothetical protein